MRKLLILAAGATLLAVPAFAQTTTPSDPAQGASGVASQPNPSSDMGPAQAPAPQAPTAQPNSAMPSSDTPSAMTPNAAAPAPETGMSSGTTGGTRMYSTAGNPADVQVVSNGPIPDTAANRAKYKPLSHAGRHTKAAGN